MRCDGYLSPPTQPKPRSMAPIALMQQARGLRFRAGGYKRSSLRLHVCSAEFLISYPYQCGSFSPKTTKRMGAIAACDLYRDGRHSVEYNFIFGHVSIWHGFHKNARTNRIILTIARPRCRDGQRGADGLRHGASTVMRFRRLAFRPPLKVSRDGVSTYRAISGWSPAPWWPGPLRYDYFFPILRQSRSAGLTAPRPQVRGAVPSPIRSRGDQSPC